MNINGYSYKKSETLSVNGKEYTAQELMDNPKVFAQLMPGEKSWVKTKLWHERKRKRKEVVTCLKCKKSYTRMPRRGIYKFAKTMCNKCCFIKFAVIAPYYLDKEYEAKHGGDDEEVFI